MERRVLTLLDPSIHGRLTLVTCHLFDVNMMRVDRDNQW